MKRYLISVIIGLLAFAAGCQAGPSVTFEKGDDKIDVLIDGKPFTSYLFGGKAYQRGEGLNEDGKVFLSKPVLFPVRSPSGVVVTRGYPLVEVEGERNDHPHHVGSFFTYDKINGNDFWNGKQASPQIKHVKVVEMKGGSGKGKLSTVMHWVGKDGKVVLEEKRSMVFIAGENEYSIDFSIDLVARGEKVVFGDTKEGMFAVRTAGWLREKGGNGKYLSSNGDETAKNVWGKRAKWVRIEGDKDGKVIGIAILHHPSSVNYPTYWHARNYGLFAANPLGQYVFEKKRNPETAKRFNLTLAAGENAHFGFRVIVYEGTRTKGQLESEFKQFAK